MQRKISLLTIKNNIPEVIGIIIALAGLLVMAGWFLDIGLLKSILPVWVSMKFATALAFFLSGIMLYFMARFQSGDRDLALVVLPLVCLIISLLMVSLLASTIIGLNIGVEEFFVKDSIVAVKSVTPGRPAIATMINFLFIVIAGIGVSCSNNFSKALKTIATLVGVIGLIAVFGYILNQPWLYFMVVSKSSAMALHTAMLFVLWGYGVIWIRKDSDEHL